MGDRSKFLRVSDGVIDEVAAEIRAIYRAAALSTHYNIGRIIVERIYGSDLDGIRRDGQRALSFAKLAARGDLPLGRAGLWRCVRLYELIQRMPEFERSKHLTLSHARAVYSLPDVDQVKLLGAAERHAWPAEKLEKMVSEQRRLQGARRGRPPIEPVLKATRALRRAVDRNSVPPDGIASLDEAEADEAVQYVNDLLEWANSLKEALDEHLEALKRDG